jgi:hypothetical protein
VRGRERQKLKLFISSTSASSEPIEMGDVQQGKLDDCYLLAPMAALANTPKGQALLRSMIKETRDIAGSCGS